jgi:hypothetical protein
MSRRKVNPGDDQVLPGGPVTPADDVEVGFTGARFGGAPRRKRKSRAERLAEKAAVEPAAPDASGDPDPDPGTTSYAVVPATQVPLPPPEPEVPAVGFTGARFGGAARRRRSDDPGPQPGTTLPAVPEPVVVALPPPMAVAEMAVEHTNTRFVRPYVYTRGRTRSRYELALETLVSTPAAAFERPELAEHLPVLDLCRRATSIAEVAALIGVPIGVARVIVGDLAVAGGLVVHRTVSAEGPDVGLMERVLSGLRRL